MAIAANMVDTVRALVNDASLLVRQEVQLAKAEASEKVEEATAGIAAMVAAGVIALAALLVLVQALVVALTNWLEIPASLSSLLVGVGLAIIAFMVFSAGKSKLSSENLKPKRTLRSVRDDVHTIREAA